MASEAVERITAHILETYGAQPEFLWARTPNNAVFRHSGTGKWFAALLLDVPRRSLGLPGEGRADILDLKCGPAMIGSLLDGVRYFPGYHMNKEHWISVALDGSVDTEELHALLAESFARTAPKKRAPRTKGPAPAKPGGGAG